MAGIISENYLSRPFTLDQDRAQSGRELVYDILNTDDEEEVRTLIQGVAPLIYLSQLLRGISAEPQGGGVWKGYARYNGFENNNEYTFDTTGGTARVTQSYATISSYAPAGLTAPNFNGAIGVSEDRVEGVDVPSPVFQFSETYQFAEGAVTLAYKLALFNLTGRFNDAAFKGLAAGECLFLGASGGKRGDEQWSITFRFAGSPNVTGLSIGGMTIDKLGWDYLWFRYADYQDSSAVALVKRPVSAHVDRVHLPGDFSTLNIGT